MVTTASREKKDRGRQWQRATTRAAILAAARRLADRGNLEQLSLTAVAREADFAPTTVFAYFANKNDLFLALLANDLAHFAASMREITVSSVQGAPQSDEMQAPKPRVSEAAPVAEQARAWLRVVEQDDPPVVEGPPVVEAPLPPVVEAPAAYVHENAPAQEPRRETGEALGTIAQELGQLREAVARIEARPVDQWLERRLREFERGLNALQLRPERTETISAQAALENSLRTLTARVDVVELKQGEAANDIAQGVRERAEQVERRLRATLSDIEAAHARDRARIDALENAAFAVAPKFFPAKAEPPPVTAPDSIHAKTEPALSDANVAAATESVTAEPPPIADIAIPEPVESNMQTANVSEGSFLAAARRSALAAAELHVAKPPARARVHKLTKRALYGIATGLGLIVALIWIGVYFKAMAVTAQPTPEFSATRIVAAQAGIAVKHRVHTRAAASSSSNDQGELTLALRLLDAKNDADGARLISMLAQRGDAVAAFKLATLYRDGRGVPADAAKAFVWFGTAAAKGNLKAKQSLAVAYAEGWGTGKDPAEAARWFTRAALLGLTDAQFNLGVLYERGLGVPQSLADAYKWYLVAAAQGDAESRTRIEAIRSQLAESELAAAEQAAESFKAQPIDRGANMAPAPAPSPAG